MLFWLLALIYMPRKILLFTAFASKFYLNKKDNNNLQPCQKLFIVDMHALKVLKWEIFGPQLDPVAHPALELKSKPENAFQ